MWERSTLRTEEQARELVLDWLWGHHEEVYGESRPENKIALPRPEVTVDMPPKKPVKKAVTRHKGAASASSSAGKSATMKRAAVRRKGKTPRTG